MSRRSEGRTAVEIAGRCTASDGFAYRIHVSDLSLNGCRIFCSLEGLHQGQRVEIMLASIGPLPAELRWIETCTDGILAGVRFDVAIHPALLDHFAAYCRIAG